MLSSRFQRYRNIFLSFLQNLTIFLFLLEYDIDGATLKIMNNIERISTIIPKFKQQLLFLEEREKLFSTNCVLTECDGSSTTITTTPQRSSIGEPAFQPLSTTTTNGPSSTVATELSADCLPKSPTNNSISDEFDNGTNVHVPFPDEYDIPPLPNSLIKDIEDGNLNKFGPHYTNRQILIDAISYDLIDKYKLL